MAGVPSVEVTVVRAFETGDSSTRVFIGVNDQSRAGANPLYSDTHCEL